MGVLDEKQKRYFSDPKRFADVWNALMLRGLELVNWMELEEKNAVLKGAGRDGGKEGTADMIMKKMANGNMLAMLILENQKMVDYELPIRIFLGGGKCIQQASEQNKTIQ